MNKECAKAQGPERKENVTVPWARICSDTNQRPGRNKLKLFLPVLMQRPGRLWRRAEFASSLYSSSPNRVTKFTQTQLPGQAGVRSWIVVLLLEDSKSPESWPSELPDLDQLCCFPKRDLIGLENKEGSGESNIYPNPSPETCGSKGSRVKRAPLSPPRIHQATLTLPSRTDGSVSSLHNLAGQGLGFVVTAFWRLHKGEAH